jgi:hypothetical protein
LGLQDRRSWPFFGRKEKRQEKTDSSATTYLPPEAPDKQILPSETEIDLISDRFGPAANCHSIKLSLKGSYKYILAR